MATKSVKLSTGSVMAVCVLICVVMLIALIGGGRAFYIRITHNAHVITAYQDAEKTLNANIENIPKLKTAYDGLGSTAGLVNDSLPSTSDFASLVATSEAIAGASGISLTSVSPQSLSLGAAATTPVTSTAVAGAASSTPQPLGFSMAVKGNYATILKFMANLQLSSRPIKMTSVQLNGTTASLTGTISGQAYYFNPLVLENKTEAVK